MRSLTLKLTLAFLFVSVIGVAFTALFIRQRTQSEFDRFVLDRYQSDLMDDLATYYRQNGSWDDISAIVVRGHENRFGRGMAMMPAPVTLANDEGSVIYGGRRFRAGQQVPADQMERAIPVEVDGETVGWVLFSDFLQPDIPIPESPETRFLNSVNEAVILGVFSAVVVALLLGILLARTISRPVREVTAATQLVAGGDLGTQVPVRTKDEIGELAASFNLMSADLAQANEQRRQMTADIAHDLRSPMSVILGYLEALSAGKLEPTPETFEILYARGKHLQHLIDDLRTLALADAGELTLTRRPVEPAALLEHTALAHMVQAKEKDISIKVDAPQDLPLVQVDPDRLAQVLGNLINNALRYTPEGGQITLSAEAGQGDLLLKILDTGSGIDPEDLPHIFDRFYRSDKSRRQNGEAGLGLAIARSLVVAHGGSITAASDGENGSTFTVSLPLW